jgi:glucose-6-phosphate 1-dehydrogenase
VRAWRAGVVRGRRRWDGVPFVLKAGKALTDRKAEVRIQFHHVPGAVSALKDVPGNELVVRLQPDETIYWKVVNKVPGLKFQVQQMRMDLLYANKARAPPPSCERPC